MEKILLSMQRDSRTGGLEWIYSSLAQFVRKWKNIISVFSWGEKGHNVATKARIGIIYYTIHKVKFTSTHPRTQFTKLCHGQRKSYPKSLEKQSNAKPFIWNRGGYHWDHIPASGSEMYICLCSIYT